MKVSDHYCFFCKSRDPEDFKVHNARFVCDECMSICDDAFSEAKDDIRIVYNRKNDNDMWDNEFLEGLAEYLEFKNKEYDEEVRRSRKHG